MHQRRLRSLALITVLASVALGARPQEPARLLALARQALGGEAALTAVTSLTVEGSASNESVPGGSVSAVSFFYVVPDKFVRVTRRDVSRGPFGNVVITTTQGFSGDDPIQETVAPGLPFPAVIETGPPPRTPDEIAAARARRVVANKRIFIQFMLPLFVSSFAATPFEFAADEARAASESATDAITATTPDGNRWRLLFDATTHRPISISWMAKPVVTFSTSSIAAVNSRGQIMTPPGRALPPPGDPTANLDDVEWEVRLDDYRTADGLTWPHRLVTLMDGNRREELNLRTFTINSKIDLRKFTPSK